jgi:plastocyanin
MTFKSFITVGTFLASATMAHPADHIVTISGFAFEAANLTIAAGDSVRFVNRDSAPNTATLSNGTFDTGRLLRNGQCKLIVPSVGSFSYFCAIHVCAELAAQETRAAADFAERAFEEL